VVGHSIALLEIWNGSPEDGPYIQNMAVVIFFVLSGLLITHSTRLKLAERSRPYRPTDYFIDRFSRIYTAFLPGLFAILAIDLVSDAFHPAIYSTFRGAFDVPTFFGNVLMLQDFPAQGRVTTLLGVDPITSFGSARPLWTVAVEWWIYLAFGWGLVILTRFRSISKGVRLLYLLPLIPLAIVPMRNLIRIPLGGPGRGHGLFIMWLFGAAISYAWPVMRTTKVSQLAWLTTSVCLTVGSVASLYLLDVDAYQLPFAAGLAVALACAITGLEQRHKSSLTPARSPSRTTRITRFFANYAFSLYLLHYSIIMLLLGWAHSNEVWLLVMFLTSNLVAIVFAWLIEQRYPLVRKRLQKWVDHRGPTLTRISRGDHPELQT
jgi:peptidoglycan/LPS O-acetylase OafA/YrhL